MMEVHYWDLAGQTTSVIGGGSIFPGVADSNTHSFGLLWLPANGAINGKMLRDFDGVEQVGADFSYASGSQGAASDTFHNMMMIAPGDAIVTSFKNIQVWNYLLKRDLDTANDNAPAWLNIAA